MFVGHLALAFSAKTTTPRTSLGWLIGAVTAADLLWPLFVLAGIETLSIQPGATAFTPLVFDSYPWSHSLVMLLVWGVVLGIFVQRRGADTRALWIIAALVVSHWLLDYVTHAPDMPLWPTATSPRLGLALWNSIPGTFIVEGALWLACLTLFLRRYRARSRMGTFAFWSFVVVSTLMWAASPWSPPPPSVQSVAIFSLIGWITVPWAIWIDRGFVERVP